MDWTKIKMGGQSKLCYVHHLMYMHGGHNYSIEVQQYSAREFVGYMESTTDSSKQLKPASAETLESCVTSLIHYLTGQSSS